MIHAFLNLEDLVKVICDICIQVYSNALADEISGLMKDYNLSKTSIYLYLVADNSEIKKLWLISN